ncbi:hypothetical protein D3C84_717100 [compost metagenome]
MDELVLVAVDLPVGVDVVVLVHVDIDVAAAPVAIAPEGVDDAHADAEGQARRQAGGDGVAIAGRWRIVGWRVGRVRPGAVDHGGVVAGHVDHLRVGGLDDDGLGGGRRLHHGGGGAGRRGRGLLDGDILLLVGFQVAGGLGFAAQPLDGIHHVIRLGEEGVPHALHPGRVLAKGGEHLREGHQGLHAGVPGLVGHLFHGVVALGIRVGL